MIARDTSRLVRNHFDGKVFRYIKEILFRLKYMASGWPQIQRNQFSVSFHGPSVESNEIDAKVLANSLMGISSVMEEANRELYRQQSTIYIKVKGSPTPGSFIIDFIAFMSSNIIDAAVNIIAITGFGGQILDSIEDSLLGLYKKTKGEKITKVRDISEDKVEVKTIKGGTNFFANKLVVNLYMNERVRRGMAQVVTPLEDIGMSEIEFKSPDHPSVKIKRDEKDYFKPPESEEVNVTITEEYLLVISPNLEGESRYWHFSSGESGKTFDAEVKDSIFLEKVKNRSYSFVEGTIVKARVRTIQWKKIRLRNEYEIEEILEFHSP